MMFRNQRGEEVHLADNLTLKELTEEREGVKHLLP